MKNWIYRESFEKAKKNTLKYLRLLFSICRLESSSSFKERLLPHSRQTTRRRQSRPDSRPDLAQTLQTSQSPPSSEVLRSPPDMAHVMWLDITNNNVPRESQNSNQVLQGNSLGVVFKPTFSMDFLKRVKGLLAPLSPL